MEKAFVDTDIVLDLLSRRMPFYNDAALLFSAADKNEINLYVSTLSFSNLNYILSRQLTSKETRLKLFQFKSLVTVLPISDKSVDLALASDFKDFEDALQYYMALEHNLKVLLTRNLKDYKNATIVVLTAGAYMESIP